jgi:predicted nucleotide-binding protein
MARSNDEKKIIIKKFTYAEIESALSRIKRLLVKLDEIESKNLGCDAPENASYESTTRKTILEIYGQYSPEYDELQYFEIWDGDIFLDMSDQYRNKGYKNGFVKARTILNQLIDELKEKQEYKKADSKEKCNLNECFIVHGRNVEIELQVTRVVEKLGIRQIVLKDKPTTFRTIIEKFEKYSNVGFAVVILTADDYGCLMTEYKDEKSLFKRARQNVILELGYFIGKIGRDKVFALTDGIIENPSDIDGYEYVKYDTSSDWKMKLLASLKYAGYSVDANKLIDE